MTGISIDHDPSPETVQQIVRSLVATNAEVAPPEEHRSLAMVAREGDKPVGGCKAHTHWGWLFISHLWVAPSHRSRGLGSRLLSSAEQQAVERGCRAAWLDTHSFQAAPFYERHGYREFGRLDDYPTGHQRHFFWKQL